MIEDYTGTSLRELKKENKFYVPHLNTINNLNNIYFVTELAREAIIKKREDLINENDHDIEIDYPDINGDLKKVTRSKSKAVKILKRSIRHDLYANSLISSVAATEGFMEQIVQMCLLKDPRRLSHSVKKQSRKGKLSEPEIEVKIDDSTIPLRGLLEANNFEDLYSGVIQDKLYQLMYASPADHFGYLKIALGIEILSDVRDAYVEIKATRDLLTHSQGIVNEIYMSKAGINGRVKKTGRFIPLSSEYFSQSVGLMKRLVGDIYVQASMEYLGIKNKIELYPNKRS